jgi:hypothetical protein
MKRRYMMLGLTVLLMLVLLAALAGPANGQADKWKEFTATFESLEYAPGMVWYPGGTELPDGTILPKQVMQNRDEYYAGPYTALDADGNTIDELSGYLVVYSDWRMFDKHGNYVVRYVNKSTLYVGATSAADVGKGVWEMSAVGDTVYLFDPDTGEPLGVTDRIQGAAHGVSGDVKGWVMKFTGAFADAAGYYLEK